jgi:hypothetical protein
MKRFAVALFVFFLILGVGAMKAHTGESPDSGLFQVELSVGEDFDLCNSGAIACPAKRPICDDLRIVMAVDLSSGLGFRGMAPGATLCSAASAIGPRLVFRVVVR